MSDSPQTSNDLGPATPGEQPSFVEQIHGRDLQSRIVDILRTIFDPEIPVNIYDMGLIYDIDASPEGAVAITMTLTSPMCPVAGSLPPEVEQKVAGVLGVTSAKVDIVWDPPWTPDKMTEAAKLQLGML